MHYKMFSSIPGFYPLDDKSIKAHAELQQPKCLQTLRKYPPRGKATLVENHWPKIINLDPLYSTQAAYRCRSTEERQRRLIVVWWEVEGS